MVSWYFSISYSFRRAKVPARSRWAFHMVPLPFSYCRANVPAGSRWAFHVLFYIIIVAPSARPAAGRHFTLFSEQYPVVICAWWVISISEGCCLGFGSMLCESMFCVSMFCGSMFRASMSLCIESLCSASMFRGSMFCESMFRVSMFRELRCCVRRCCGGDVA